MTIETFASRFARWRSQLAADSLKILTLAKPAEVLSALYDAWETRVGAVRWEDGVLPP